MKSIWCTIWILIALVVIATVDALPDPPAVNPGSSIASVLHHSSCDAATRRSDPPCASRLFPASMTDADTLEPYRPSDCPILTAQAADPSPPHAS